MQLKNWWRSIDKWTEFFYIFVKRHVSAIQQDHVIQLAQLLVQSGLSVFPQAAQLLRLDF